MIKKKLKKGFRIFVRSGGGKKMEQKILYKSLFRLHEKYQNIGKLENSVKNLLKALLSESLKNDPMFKKINHSTFWMKIRESKWSKDDFGFITLVEYWMSAFKGDADSAIEFFDVVKNVVQILRSNEIDSTRYDTFIDSTIAHDQIFVHNANLLIDALHQKATLIQ